MVVTKEPALRTWVSRRWLISLVLFFSLLIPVNRAHASGGGPILVLFCLSTFVLGIVPVLFIEAVVYWRLTRLSIRKVLADVFVTNGTSFVLVFVFAPITIAGSGLISALFPSSNSGAVLAFTTWIFDSQEFFDFAVIMTVVWFVFLIGCAVVVESWVFSRIWCRRDESIEHGAFFVSLMCNVPSSIFAAVIGALIWRDLFFHRGLFPSSTAVGSRSSPRTQVVVDISADSAD